MCEISARIFTFIYSLTDHVTIHSILCPIHVKMLRESEEVNMVLDLPQPDQFVLDKTLLLSIIYSSRMMCTARVVCILYYEPLHIMCKLQTRCFSAKKFRESSQLN